MISLALEQIDGTLNRITEKRHRYLKKLDIQYIIFLNFIRKEISSPRRTSRPIILKVRFKQKRSLFNLFWYETSCAFTSRNKIILPMQSKSRSSSSWRTELPIKDLTNLTQRKNLTTSENWMHINNEIWKSLLKCYTRETFQTKLEKNNSSRLDLR